MTTWLALSPASHENGCIRVIPGTHIGEVLKHYQEAWGGSLERDPSKAQTADAQQAAAAGLRRSVFCYVSSTDAQHAIRHLMVAPVVLMVARLVVVMLPIWPVEILQNTFSDRARCIAQLRPGSSFLLSALRFLDREGAAGAIPGAAAAAASSTSWAPSCPRKNGP